MPHVTVQMIEEELDGVEEALIAGLTDAVTSVYGEWVRPNVAVALHGVPRRRWGITGDTAAIVTLGMRERAFERVADLPERLIPALTDALAAAAGERIRAHVTVTLVGIPAGREGVGGAIPA